MTLRAVSPATMPELIDLYAAIAPLKPIEFKALMVQYARSHSEAYYAGDELVAAAMYYPLPDEVPGEALFELAFACKPDLRRHLVAFIHSSHLTRQRLRDTGPVRVRAHVRCDHRPGQRLAALCGMRKVAVIGNLERWEFEGRTNGKICRGHQVAIQRA